MKGEPSIEELAARDHLSQPERDIILAALRFWQRCAVDGAAAPEMDIALNGRLTCLDDYAIDKLCERLNS